VTIHREGYASLFLTSGVLIALNVSLYFLHPETVLLNWGVGTVSVLLFLIVLQFFRHPEVITPSNTSNVLAPADGKVVVIEKVFESEFLKAEAIQVSIFMSPVNVHVNRVPVNGTVIYQKYHPGKYLVAWHPKSSTENERTSVALRMDSGKRIMMRQIAGALARRIVCYAKEGMNYEQGHEFGFIKFGSRVDIFLPLDAVVTVSLGEITKGGVSTIAQIGA
jgi:phosphatidylserine decarboxylase